MSVLSNLVNEEIDSCKQIDDRLAIVFILLLKVKVAPVVTA
jgi:hypothetical protein